MEKVEILNLQSAALRDRLRRLTGTLQSLLKMWVMGYAANRWFKPASCASPAALSGGSIAPQNRSRHFCVRMTHQDQRAARATEPCRCRSLPYPADVNRNLRQLIGCAKAVAGDTADLRAVVQAAQQRNRD